VTAVRERVRDHVAANPGVHFNAVVRQLDLAPGQVQHHVRSLRDDGALAVDGFYGRTHYFPPETPEWERAALALARRETARDVLLCLLDTCPSSPSDVAERVGVARSTPRTPRLEFRRVRRRGEAPRRPQPRDARTHAA